MIPALPRGVRLRHDAVRGQDVLLGPERALMLDPIAKEILSRVDGAVSEAAIVDDLAATFGAPREQIAGDVRAFLDDLGAKMLVTFHEGRGHDG